MDKLVPRNRLLLALPDSNLQLILPELQQIPCERAEVLMDVESAIDRVIFPDAGVVSIVAVYADGDMIEMATIGREGCAPVNAILGAKMCSARLIVQIPGSATVMSRADFIRAMKSMPAFRNVMHAYVQAFLEQIQVSVACNGSHDLKSRLARWLLMMRDRADGDELQITQDLLGEVLGVQRPSVTNAIRQLEHAGLIECGRRKVVIRDRGGLMQVACECYRLVREHIAANLPKTYA
ncbi:MAG TPA: Crp/Fnr family transcriptional regulator [Candidatus Binataceae bacterium]|nr:Crp/Fnr family transcriptional regulator [Candidatus Binataceae bacterium]